LSLVPSSRKDRITLPFDPRAKPWSPPPRAVTIERAKSEKFDLVVIGGGCVGTGIAVDALSRGLSVALVERDDFAAGTSSRSTKLIHGGVRYLEQAFKNLDLSLIELVTEALEERSFMMDSMPFMAKPLPIMLPCYSWWEIPFYFVGMKVYDWFAGRDAHCPGAYIMSKEQTMYRYPQLKEQNLKGSVVYYDGQHNDARANICLAMTAAKHGGVILNHTRFEAFEKDGEKITGVRCVDDLDGSCFQIKAKAVINATGPYSDCIRKVDDPSSKDLCVPSAGVHAIFPDYVCPTDFGLLIPKTSDGRVLFILPWEGSVVIGTTDRTASLQDLPTPTLSDVKWMLAESNKYLQRQVQRNEVLASWSGLRPLVRDPDAPPGDTKSLSRNHVIVSNATSGLVSILGGKWTTYRRMAEDAVDAAVKMHDLKAGPCKSRELAIVGTEYFKNNHDTDHIVVLREKYRMDRIAARHLVHNYGDRAHVVAAIADSGFGKLLHPKYNFLEAEVIYAIDFECALTAVDAIARRTRLAFLDRDAAFEALPKVISLMASKLEWDAARQEKEYDSAVSFLDTMHAWAHYQVPSPIYAIYAHESCCFYFAAILSRMS
jgi:glycerol-3-phosphate dehydrogenase